ncbi:MAG: plasmid pRiA4b ORF-3 family protein [Treponema sp.]|nr:plasmid pRiA4b ORF-3 family protein [Treponema sp.]
MTANQEEAFYEFLDNTTNAFKLNDIISYIKKVESRWAGRLASDIEAFINLRGLAFQIGPGRWITRRGFFEPLPFVISPTRLELLNGILIPGHRCVPFANANLLPHEYNFSWQGSRISFTTTEGSPKEFYPYYSIFGEEYAPQYLARDNPGNEEAFNSDPYDDPPEVSIKTLDMRNIYRESGFVPGDRFVVRTTDWKKGEFNLERVGKDDWPEAELQSWLQSAEESFDKSFKKLGAASCTEEQIAFAYWYGDARMREVPAYSLESYLYEKSDKIDVCAYGIETRFWYAGREIPDRKELDFENMRPDKTPVEQILLRYKIPISEYVIHSYIRDSLFREGTSPKPDHDNSGNDIMERLIPASIEMEVKDRFFLGGYIRSMLEEIREFYSPFADNSMGPIRLRAGELHSAIIELALKLTKRDIDASWLPRHTFIILSQIQNHTAHVMEDLELDTNPTDAELDALDNSLDSMVETYEDIKELIDEALESFRRNKLGIVRAGSNEGKGRLLQFSIGGIDVWRRLIVPEDHTLQDLHKIIQTVFGWNETHSYTFIAGITLSPQLSIKTLELRGLKELIYEYGTKWTVRIMILSKHETPDSRPVRCVTGAGASPPEHIEGPVKFKKILSAIESRNDLERIRAKQELGGDYIYDDFDIDLCNKSLNIDEGEKQWT